MGRVEPELVGIPGKILIRDTTRRSGSLSMQPVGYTPWCSTYTADFKDVEVTKHATCLCSAFMPCKIFSSMIMKYEKLP